MSVTASETNSPMDDEKTKPYSWREGTSSPFLEHIDQENIAPPPINPHVSADLSLPAPETPSRKKFGSLTTPNAASVAKPSARRQRDDFEICAISNHTPGSIAMSKAASGQYEMPPSSVASTPTVSPKSTLRAERLQGSVRKYGQSADGTPTKDEISAIADEMAYIRNQGVEDAHATVEYQSETTDVTEEQTNVDDTCFTTFSEIPNAEVTQYTKMPSGSPLKQCLNADITPKRRGRQPSPSHSPSPTPRRNTYQAADGDNTNLLLDFTQQIESFSCASRRTPSKMNSASPMKFQSQPNLLSFINNQRSPGKGNYMPSTPAERQSILNLLDFELPPAPTPRSIPTVTARELESLKSQYLSEISSLKATLSGKCAEVDSLKKAVADAERRVGQAQEELREESSAKDYAERERTEWEKKGQEVEEILQAIRKEVMSNEKDMEQLQCRLQESEIHVADAQSREADARVAAAEAERKAAALAASADGTEQIASAEHIAKQVQKELDEKIGAISSELHAVYKKKHETKVATLKKSYEARAEKKCAELQKRIGELSKQNEELQLSKDATFSGVIATGATADASAGHQADLRRLEEQKVEIEQQKAKLAGMFQELDSVKGQQALLLQSLEAERAEKGELVAAAEEMLGLQHDAAGTDRSAAVAGMDDFKRSISRCSGLRPPTGSSMGESRIGRGGLTGLARPTTTGLKSRLATNIERMGNGGRMGFE